MCHKIWDRTVSPLQHLFCTKMWLYLFYVQSTDCSYKRTCCSAWLHTHTDTNTGEFPDLLDHHWVMIVWLTTCPWPLVTTFLSLNQGFVNSEQGRNTEIDSALNACEEKSLTHTNTININYLSIFLSPVVIAKFVSLYTVIVKQMTRY